MSSGIIYDMESFDRHLIDSNLTQIQLDREILTFEREPFTKDILERERERAEHKEERDNIDKVEIDKLKLLIESFQKV